MAVSMARPHALLRKAKQWGAGREGIGREGAAGGLQRPAKAGVRRRRIGILQRQLVLRSEEASLLRRVVLDKLFVMRYNSPAVLLCLPPRLPT